MGLYLEQHRTELDAATVVASGRSDALRGLGEVLDAAMRMVEQTVPTVLRVVDFLLR
jgi:hypothetical protein